MIGWIAAGILVVLAVLALMWKIASLQSIHEAIAEQSGKLVEAKGGVCQFSCTGQIERIEYISGRVYFVCKKHAEQLHNEVKDVRGFPQV